MPRHRPCVVETATLPPERAALYFMPWLVFHRSGYVLGCSSEACAKRFLSAAIVSGL